MVPILKEYTYSYKMDTKSENSAMGTFDLGSHPLNVFMTSKLPQSLATMSEGPQDNKNTL